MVTCCWVDPIFCIHLFWSIYICLFLVNVQMFWKIWITPKKERRWCHCGRFSNIHTLFMSFNPCTFYEMPTSLGRRMPPVGGTENFRANSVWMREIKLYTNTETYKYMYGVSKINGNALRGRLMMALEFKIPKMWFFRQKENRIRMRHAAAEETHKGVFCDNQSTAWTSGLLKTLPSAGT